MSKELQPIGKAGPTKLENKARKVFPDETVE
jgi:hypothetical protein